MAKYIKPEHITRAGLETIRIRPGTSKSEGEVIVKAVTSFADSLRSRMSGLSFNLSARQVGETLGEALGSGRYMSDVHPGLGQDTIATFVAQIIQAAELGREDQAQIQYGEQEAFDSTAKLLEKA